MNRGMLTGEEQRQKEQLIVAIEETLQAKGIECDKRIGKMGDQELLEILGAARILLREVKRRKAQRQGQALAQ